MTCCHFFQVNDHSRALNNFLTLQKKKTSKFSCQKRNFYFKTEEADLQHYLLKWVRRTQIPTQSVAFTFALMPLGKASITFPSQLTSLRWQPVYRLYRVILKMNFFHCLQFWNEVVIVILLRQQNPTRTLHPYPTNKLKKIYLCWNFL